MATVTEYLDKVSPGQKAEFERIRNIIKQIAPEAEEIISYGMPAFKYKNRNLVYFGVFKDHMSLFLASDSLVKTLGKELSDFRTSKGTLQFTEDNPIPDPLLKKIIRLRLNDLTKA